MAPPIYLKRKRKTKMPLYEDVVKKAEEEGINATQALCEILEEKELKVKEAPRPIAPVTGTDTKK